MPFSSSQQTAVTGSGVQLILAGPGSGKTKVITEKILHLINQGVQPKNILAHTFSDKVAHEMLERLAPLRGKLFSMNNLLVFLSILAGALIGCFGIALGSDAVLTCLCTNGTLPAEIGTLVCRNFWI